MFYGVFKYVYLNEDGSFIEITVKFAPGLPLY